MPKRSTSPRQTPSCTPQGRYVVASSSALFLRDSLSPRLLVSLSPDLLVRIQIDRRRHSETQLIRRIFYEHTDFINQACAQLLGLYRFGREFGDRGDKPAPAFETALGKTIHRNSRGDSLMKFAQIRLGYIGSHPLRISDRQREGGLLRRRHLAGLPQSRADHGSQM